MKNNKTVGYKIQTIRENKNMSRKRGSRTSRIKRRTGYTNRRRYRFTGTCPAIKNSSGDGGTIKEHFSMIKKSSGLLYAGICKRIKVSVSRQIHRMRLVHMEYYSLSKSKSNRHGISLFI